MTINQAKHYIKEILKLCPSKDMNIVLETKPNICIKWYRDHWDIKTDIPIELSWIHVMDQRANSVMFQPTFDDFNDCFNTICDRLIKHYGNTTTTATETSATTLSGTANTVS
jgi:hypothetical protein